MNFHLVQAFHLKYQYEVQRDVGTGRNQIKPVGEKGKTWGVARTTFRCFLKKNECTDLNEHRREEVDDQEHPQEDTILSLSESTIDDPS